MISIETHFLMILFIIFSVFMLGFLFGMCFIADKEEENTLRKIIKNKEERNIELYKENNKLKQTLTEIKEIAEENIRIADLEGLNGVYRRGLAKQILQKISECEVKNEN